MKVSRVGKGRAREVLGGEGARVRIIEPGECRWLGYSRVTMGKPFAIAFIAAILGAIAAVLVTKFVTIQSSAAIAGGIAGAIGGMMGALALKRQPPGGR